DDRSVAWHGDDFRTPASRLADEEVPVAPHNDDRPAAFATPSLFDRSVDGPPQVIEREVTGEASHDADDRVPYEPLFAHASQAERPRAAILPAALMLIVGLLIGWGGAKFSEWRRQEVVESTAASKTATPTPAPAAEPEGRPA